MRAKGGRTAGRGGVAGGHPGDDAEGRAGRADPAGATMAGARPVREPGADVGPVADKGIGTGPADGGTAGSGMRGVRPDDEAEGRVHRPDRADGTKAGACPARRGRAAGADAGPGAGGAEGSGPREDGTPGARRADGAAAIRERWEVFYRKGPYALLALATVISAATAGMVMSPTGRGAALVLVAAALVLHLWWSRLCRTRPDASERPGGLYYGLRTVLAFALSWTNPFFAVYAVLGYFDTGHTLPARWVRPGLIATAVTMSGSQSGGMPPAGVGGWLLFAAMFALNAFLVLLFARLAIQEEENAAANEATIVELELANTRLAQALEENAGLHAQLIAQAREAGVDDERRRLAAEIHDTLAQGLAGIITQLQAAADSTDPAAARAHTDRAAALARQSLAEARRSVYDLGPGALEHDALPEALEKVTSAWSATAGVPAEYTVTGTAEPLHAEIEATLLRIAQEALTNVARHAGAHRVGVTLSYMDDEVTLDVRDDGRGFDPGAPPARDAAPGSGFGLGGMRARAERIAGTVDVEAEPGQGTAISARVPLVRHG